MMDREFVNYSVVKWSIMKALTIVNQRFHCLARMWFPKLHTSESLADLLH